MDVQYLFNYLLIFYAINMYNSSDLVIGLDFDRRGNTTEISSNTNRNPRTS